jgi:hypothetical protein
MFFRRRYEDKTYEAEFAIYQYADSLLDGFFGVGDIYVRLFAVS